MSETNIYVYIVPLAILFIALEVGATILYKRDLISFPEAIANFGTALVNQTTNVLVMIGVYYAYGWLYENFRILTIELNWWSFILLLLGIDFIFYWVHRWGHEINILWAAHSPHHSAEEMNFFVAIRASVTQRLCSFLFFWPLTLIGFRPDHIYMVSVIHLFVAFLHHTEYIRKLGWFEKYFTTPSHHRVHHGVNFQYLDKNFGEFLIIWDKMFGTFAEEKEKVIYGMYSHPQSWNPVKINFHYFMVLWRDAAAAEYWWDKIRIWLMPAGWRPRGLEQKEMVEITRENQVRYRPPMFAGARVYLIFSLVPATLLMLGIISNLYRWTPGEKWMAAGLLWLQMITWGGILEAKKWVWPVENLRIVVTLLAAIVFSELYSPSVIAAFMLAAAGFSLIWTNLYFRPNSPTLQPA
jgi:sterol desaturase/sphingolipid hydroxylase (fatty acid hydroxylase superfamily)